MPQGDELLATIGALDLDDVASVLDINGSAMDLALALHQRFGSKIAVVGVSPDGTVEPPKDLDRYVGALSDQGVDHAAIRVVSTQDDLEPVDVVATLNGFGATHAIGGLTSVLGQTLHGQSRLVLDIRAGSGTYPFLKRYGGCNTVAEGVGPDANLFRVVMSVEPQETNVEAWSALAEELAGEDGFYRMAGRHSFLYVPRGDTLVVTFDNLDIAMEKRDDRRPWGYGYIEAQGWSVLGVMAPGWTWYRDADVIAAFERLRDDGFFSHFKRVVFYGASMGGYAAAAFSGVAPGATVVAISPQSTLDKTVVPWETRYRKVWDADFSGPFGDASEVSHQAREVHLFFDPYVSADASHAARFTAPNVRKWRCPLLGHRLGSSLSQMGVLPDIVTPAIDGSLTASGFRESLRARRDFPRYQRELANLAMDRGKPELARRVCQHVLKSRDDAFFRKMLKRL